MLRTASKAFTLSELLIALGILGVIATFTIPKVLQAQQNSKYKVIAKESAAMLSGAYQAYQQHNGPAPSSFYATSLTPYMNYVKFDTSSTLDDIPGYGTSTCNNTSPCIKLHNGSLAFFPSGSFGGTSSSHAVNFKIDPDGASGGAKSVTFILYYNGRLTTRGTYTPPTYIEGTVWNWTPNPAEDPSWFSWN